MSTAIAPTSLTSDGSSAPPRRRRLRVAGAALAALVANAVAATATDQLFHELGVYPPWGQPMYDAGDNALALGYRTVYAVLGGYLAARLAPEDGAAAPMRAALAYGLVGFVLSVVGAVVTITQFDWGPAWYPVLLAAVALPGAWAGGALQRRGRAGR